MIIDSHTHAGFGRYINANPKDLIASIKRAGINRAMIFAGDIGDCSTEKLLEEVKPYKDILYPIGSVSPISQNKPSIKQLESWLESDDIYGLKFYTGYEYFYPYDDIVEPYLKILEQFRKPAIFHIGDTYNAVKEAKLSFAMPINIDEIAVRHPNMPIVIAHMGNPWLLDAATVAYKNDNVFYDCSGWVYGAFPREDEVYYRRKLSDIRGYVGNFEKMIFGTDWPISDQKSYVSFLNSIPFTAKERKKVFSQNAIDIFKLRI